MEWLTTRFLQQWDSPSRNEAAAQLTEHFTPMIIRYGQARGLPHEIAEDAAQDTMAAIVKDLRNYRGSRGRLRDWIRGIANNKIDTHLRRLCSERAVRHMGQTDFWENVPDEKAAKHTWNTEFHKMEIEWCLEQARKNPRYDPKTFEAFELLFRPGMDTAVVAQELGMSNEAVRVAKHRVLSHIRELMKQFDESF